METGPIGTEPSLKYIVCVWGGVGAQVYLNAQGRRG